MAYPPPPYADARCGGFVCGEAICGAWWAYTSSAKLVLKGVIPQVEAINLDVPPPARLVLGGYAPTVRYNVTIVATPAGVVFGAVAPTFALSTILIVTPAGLALGAVLPTSVAKRFINAITCTDLDLVTDPEREVVLVAAGAADLDLEQASCL